MRPRRVPSARPAPFGLLPPLLLLAAACAHLAPASEGAAAGDRRPKVLMVFLDGFLPDAIARTDTPNLDRLLGHAAWSLQARAESTTISGSGWSTFVTGVHWDKHGVPDNAFEHPRYDRYRHAGALLREARPEARWASCQSWKPIEEGLVRPARPDFHFYVDYDGYQGDHFAPDSVDVQVAGAAERILREEDPDLAIVMFGEMDSVAHSEDNQHYDADDPLYQRILHRTDALLGRLLDAIEARPTRAREDWLVLVSADHAGSKGLGHGRNIPAHRQIPLIASGDAVVPGEIWPPPEAADVVATALHHLGVTPPPEWELDGRPVGFTATAPPMARLGVNLLFDGDAEYERGFDGYQGFPDASVPGWEDPSWLTVIRYGAPGGFPGSGDALPDRPGRNFFAGGQAGHDTWMEQVVDLAPLAEDLEAGVEYELSAWLGGYAAQADRAELRAEFRDATGRPLQTAVVGPVTAADRQGRTGFRFRRTTGRVPAAARAVAIRLTCIQAEGANDGYADDLALVLRRIP